ncbi:MAG TPA: hypothetical protein VEH84_05395 [Alphaproteobacteria bacterium]|nr:hypothetical protein [Alphaproteobacteria bacterium]
MDSPPHSAAPPVTVGLHAVIVAVSDEQPRLLVVRKPSHSLARAAALGAVPAADPALAGLPYGPFDPEHDRTLELGLRRWVQALTRQPLGYVEQLYTFGDQGRDPWERVGGPRVISVGYLALVRETPPNPDFAAEWQDWYRFFPWEDWRDGRPALIDGRIAPMLEAWAAAADTAARRERASIAFGLAGAGWAGETVLERYELLYEAGLVPESWRDRGQEPPPALFQGGRPLLGEPMALDHRRILATAMGRLRGKIRYRPVVFELMPPHFTLLQLQRSVEALSGVRLHKQNFRRLLEQNRLVEGTGAVEPHTGGRPAEQFRFRREVLRERPAAGIGLPERRDRTA